MILKAARILLLSIAFPALAIAQYDTVPRIVTGIVEWQRIPALAPKFQQKDLTVRIVRLNNLSQVFEREGSPAWQDDWHYMEITGDRYIDGIYSGATRHHKGHHTYLSFGDSTFKYPIAFQAPGYLHSLRYDTNGVEMILRRDPGEKEWVAAITHHYHDHRTHTNTSRWQVRVVSTTDVPALGPPDAHTLRMPTTLRTSAQDLREPPVDYDQDGRNDASGNAIAEFGAGAKVLRFASTRQGDLEWSFVMISGAHSPSPVLKQEDRKDVWYAGWIPTGAFVKQ